MGKEAKEEVHENSWQWEGQKEEGQAARSQQGVGVKDALPYKLLCEGGDPGEAHKGAAGSREGGLQNDSMIESAG